MKKTICIILALIIAKEFLSDNHIRYYIGDCLQNGEAVD